MEGEFEYRPIRYDIFLSCHSEVKAHVKKFVQSLQGKKAWRFFLAESDSNVSIEDQMKALMQSRLFVWINSRSYTESSECRRHLYWRRIFYSIKKIGIKVAEYTLAALQPGIIAKIQQSLNTNYEAETNTYWTELWYRYDQIAVIDAHCCDKLNSLKREFNETRKEVFKILEETYQVATIILDNGAFEGQVDQYYKKSGCGKLCLNDNTSYNGQWENDMKHGFGKFIYKNGGIYEGEWVYDKKHGFGKYTFSNGDIYEGDWSDGKMNGKGLFRYVSKNLYGGNWLNGEMHGKGIYWTHDNRNLYDGEWKHNKKHGRGLMMYTSNDGNLDGKYNGEWVDDMKHGFGCFTFENGDVYEGQWVKGKKHGKGFMYLANGDAFETQFENDVELECARVKTKKQRKISKKFGEILLRDSAFFKGDLVNGVPDGMGVKYYKNGDRYEGSWKNGKEFGSGTYYYKNGLKMNYFYGDDYYHFMSTSFDDVDFQRTIKEQAEKKNKEAEEAERMQSKTV